MGQLVTRLRTSAQGFIVLSVIDWLYLFRSKLLFYKKIYFKKLNFMVLFRLTKNHSIVFTRLKIFSI